MPNNEYPDEVVKAVADIFRRAAENPEQFAFSSKTAARAALSAIAPYIAQRDAEALANRQ